jgi:hypothetical protein
LNSYYHLNIEKQLERILGNLSFSSLTEASNQDNNYIKDICDGTLYKTLLDCEDGQAIKQKEALTFLFNTDGASICKSSKLTLWPVYLIINELPLGKRFSPENVILAGNHRN